MVRFSAPRHVHHHLLAALLACWSVARPASGRRADISKGREPTISESIATPSSGWISACSRSNFSLASSRVLPTTVSTPGMTLIESGERPHFAVARLEVGVEFLRRFEVLRHREQHLGGARRKLEPCLRLAGLHDHRLALRRARHHQRPAHLEMLALVMQHVELFGIEEQARRFWSRTWASSSQVSQRPCATWMNSAARS